MCDSNQNDTLKLGPRWWQKEKQSWVTFRCIDLKELHRRRIRHVCSTFLSAECAWIIQLCNSPLLVPLPSLHVVSALWNPCPPGELMTAANTRTSFFAPPRKAPPPRAAAVMTAFSPTTDLICMSHLHISQRPLWARLLCDLFDVAHEAEARALAVTEFVQKAKNNRRKESGIERVDYQKARIPEITFISTQKKYINLVTHAVSRWRWSELIIMDFSIAGKGCHQKPSASVRTWAWLSAACKTWCNFKYLKMFWGSLKKWCLDT